MSQTTMKNVNKVVLFITFLILIETIFVRLLISTPTNTSQWLSAIQVILILAWILFALYLYQSRGNKKVAVITLFVLGAYVFAKGLYYILMTGDLVAREGRIFYAYIGNIIIGGFFLLYALVMWRFGSPSIPSSGESATSH